jgi:hypothetical protein
MHSISFFSWFVFDEFIAKGGEYGHKVGTAFVLTLSFSCSSEFFLALSCHFAWLCRFSCLLLAFAVSLLLDDPLELFLAFWVF